MSLVFLYNDLSTLWFQPRVCTKMEGKNCFWEFLRFDSCGLGMRCRTCLPQHGSSHPPSIIIINELRGGTFFMADVGRGSIGIIRSLGMEAGVFGGTTKCENLHIWGFVGIILPSSTFSHIFIAFSLCIYTVRAAQIPRGFQYFPFSQTSSGHVIHNECSTEWRYEGGKRVLCTIQGNLFFLIFEDQFRGYRRVFVYKLVGFEIFGFARWKLFWLVWMYSSHLGDEEIQEKRKKNKNKQTGWKILSYDFYYD